MPLGAPACSPSQMAWKFYIQMKILQQEMKPFFNRKLIHSSDLQRRVDGDGVRERQTYLLRGLMCQKCIQNRE